MLLRLIRKDLALELRGKQFLMTLIPLALLLTTLAALGIHGAFLDQSTTIRIFPVLLWVIFFFASTAAISRSIDYETRSRAIDQILLSKAKAYEVFISKVFTNALVGEIGLLVSLIWLAMLLDIQIGQLFWPLMGIGSLVSVGYCALGTLLSALSTRSLLRELLLFLVLFPLIFPLFFAAQELSLRIVLDNNVSVDTPWFYILVLLNLLYFAAGCILFGHAIRG